MNREAICQLSCTKNETSFFATADASAGANVIVLASVLSSRNTRIGELNARKNIQR